MVIEDEDIITYVKPDPSGLNGGYKPSKVGTTGVVFEAIDGGFKILFKSM